MYLGKVIGNVVSTTKSEKLTGLKLLLVQQIDMLSMKPTGAPVVIVDSVGAGIGEVIMVVTGGSARLTEETTGKPVDGTIVGIIDTVEMDGRLLFEKYPKQQAAELKEEPIEEEAKAEKEEAKPEEAKPKKTTKSKKHTYT